MTIVSNDFLRRKWLQALTQLEVGSVTFTTPEGETHHFKGTVEGPAATFNISDWSVIRRLVMRGDIGLGEDYIAGKWSTDSLEMLFQVFLLNMEALEHFAHGSWLNRAVFRIYNTLVRANSRRGSSKNITAHYDVGNDFYQLWLDETMTYSSALYASPTTPLAEAQRAKYQRMLQKTGVGEGSEILEIGCGWGGFAEEAARAKAHVTGLTISPAQHEFATKRLEHASADIRLQDYRDVKGFFDAIVSIEMFEAVGERYWPRYFQAVAERLKKGGKAIIQTIVVRDEHFEDYRSCSDFIRHYVFPGGMLPSVARFRDEAKKAGLETKEVFAFGQDYAATLRQWLQRFDARLPEIHAMGYNDAFVRNWRFYLSICAAAFAVGRTNVVQVELAHA